MIPFILAAVGGYLIGDSMKDSQTFANGGMPNGIEKRFYASYYGHTIMIVKNDSDSRIFVNKIRNEVDGTLAKKEDYIEVENNKEAIDYIDSLYKYGGIKIGYVDTKNKRLSKYADGGEIEYTVEYEVFVDDADDPYTDNRTKTFKDLDEAIDFSNRVYASVGYEIIKDGELVEYGYVDTKNKRLSKYADGGEVEGLDVYESVFLYVKKGLKQPFREDYLKPIGLYNTEKAKEVEASLKKKGCLNSAGAINELGKNKAKEVNNFLDGALSRYITTGREYRKEKFESIKEKFLNNK